MARKMTRKEAKAGDVFTFKPTNDIESDAITAFLKAKPMGMTFSQAVIHALGFYARQQEEILSDETRQRRVTGKSHR